MRYGVRLGYGLWIGLVCGSIVFTLRWVGSVVWWVGLKKLDLRTTLPRTPVIGLLYAIIIIAYSFISLWLWFLH